MITMPVSCYRTVSFGIKCEAILTILVFTDDDFFEIHTQYDEFNELLQNYTFVLKYTGRRWYGQIYPERSSKGFDEEEYHAFWNRAFSGVGVDDNRTVIISAPTTDSSPVGVDFYEMRRRNKQFEGTEKNYNYGPFGVLLNNIGAEVSGQVNGNVSHNFCTVLYCCLNFNSFVVLLTFELGGWLFSLQH